MIMMNLVKHFFILLNQLSDRMNISKYSVIWSSKLFDKQVFFIYENIFSDGMNA